ncbi:MAG: CrcB family protein [Eubacterium sp.]|nr:CrcB family protein [Eubacterium sp.]
MTGYFHLSAVWLFRQYANVRQFRLFRFIDSSLLFVLHNSVTNAPFGVKLRGPVKWQPAVHLLLLESGIGKTLMVNCFIEKLIGKSVMGFVAGRDDVSENAILFWKTGVCGGFTTFSTFSLEAFQLIESKSYLSAGLYILLSVLCCVIGILCGRKLAELVKG